MPRPRKLFYQNPLTLRDQSLAEVEESCCPRGGHMEKVMAIHPPVDEVSISV
jgi:hypothetical protein